MVMVRVAVVVEAMVFEMMIEEVMGVNMTATVVTETTVGMRGMVVGRVSPLGGLVGCNTSC